jgi:hypothetical protein
MKDAGVISRQLCILLFQPVIMKQALLLLSVVLLVTSCRLLGGERISGNGKITTVQRTIGGFSNVRVSGNIQVHLRNDAATSVKMETDENLMEYLDIFTEGTDLIIRTRKGFNLDPSKDIIAYVAAPDFNEVSVSGSCDIVSDGIITSQKSLDMNVSGSGDIIMQVDVAKISTHISGSGSVQLKGKARDFSASVSGSGDIRCFDLATENTELNLSGSSEAQVNASSQLDIHVSGSGSVEYKGSASVTQKISGSGSVKKVD